jgi:hypothetical protein
MWHQVLLRYLAFTVVAHLVWETAQLPLYAIWTTGSWAILVFAVVHCTGGDVVIALTSLLLASVLVGRKTWPADNHGQVIIAATTIGVGYTVYSEWVNTVVRASWWYAEAMPRLPRLGTGLSPVAQRMILPPLGLWWSRRSVLRSRSRTEL